MEKVKIARKNNKSKPLGAWQMAELGLVSEL
jgi:hypothetical protein